MVEQAVKVDVRRVVDSVTKGSIESFRSKEKPDPKKQAGKKDLYEPMVEGMLRGAATRILLSYDLKELGSALESTLDVVRKGGMDMKKLDAVKLKVLDQVTKIKDEHRAETIGTQLEAWFKQGDYDKAVELLKNMAKDDEYGLPADEQDEINKALDLIKPKDKMSEAELKDLNKYTGEMAKSGQEKAKKMEEKSVMLHAEITREEMKLPPEQVEPRATKAETKIRVEDAEADKIAEEIKQKAQKLESRDVRFIRDMLMPAVGDTERTVDFETMDPAAANYIYMRAASMLGEPGRDWSDAPEVKKLLERAVEASRGRVLNEEQKARVYDVPTPDRRRWMGLSDKERAQVMDNLGFMEQTQGDWRKLLTDGEARDTLGEMERMGRTDAAMEALKKEYREKKDNGEISYDLEDLLVRNRRTGRWEWKGSRERLFDVARDELYNIQGSLTQENMSQLYFEESAQRYLALMRIDVGDDLELESVKDAITKMLYIEFATKTLWRGGGSIESWNKAASMLTQGERENFFMQMKIGEMLKTKDGKEIGRFSWEELMNVAEQKVKFTYEGKEYEQYMLTFMAGQSTEEQRRRWPVFAKALAEEVIKKKALKEDWSNQEIAAFKESLGNGSYEISNRQMQSMINYMQFMSVATFRGGEFGLNQAVVPGKFEFTDLPGGEVVQKTGPWSIVYDWYYPVTKYGGEWIGKMFLPNVNVLSYARSETLGLWIATDSKIVASMRDEHGNYLGTGVGAKEFFFQGVSRKVTDSNGNQLYDEDGNARTVEGDFAEFWGDVIFDTRTGGISESQRRDSIKNKNAINRTVDAMHRVGAAKLEEWSKEGKIGFVEHIDFTKLEEGLLHYKIPGKTQMEKFTWVVNNFDYSFWRTDLLKSKRVGDWVNKYVPKKYEEARLKLADFLNAPGEATLGALRDIVSEYSDETGVNEMGHWILKENRKPTVSWKWVDPEGNEVEPDWTGVGKFGKKLKAKRILTGYRHADRGKSKYGTLDEKGEFVSGVEDGEFWGVSQQWHSVTEGGHLDTWLKLKFPFSRQQGKELFRDPMYFEKFEIDNQFHAGMIDRKEWGKQKREWEKKIYFGDVMKEYKWKDSKGREKVFKLRWGHIPLLTPIFLIRGWWVDRMQLDWEDFLMVMRKQNQATWEEIKKAAGI